MEYYCRICFNEENNGLSDELLKPCKCKSSCVHRSCLNKWIQDSMNPTALTHCEVCHAEFQYEVIASKKEKYIALTKLIVLIMRDALIILALMIATGFLAYYISDYIIELVKKSLDEISQYKIIFCMSIIFVNGYLVLILILLSYFFAFMCTSCRNTNYRIHVPYLIYLITFDTVEKINSIKVLSNHNK